MLTYKWQHLCTFQEHHNQYNVGNNHDWVHKVGCDILGQKKLILDNYLNTVLQSGVLWDELALLIFARMYKIYIFFYVRK